MEVFSEQVTLDPGDTGRVLSNALVEEEWEGSCRHRGRPCTRRKCGVQKPLCIHVLALHRLVLTKQSLPVVCQVRLRDEPTDSLPSHGVTITMKRRHEGIGPTLE